MAWSCNGPAGANHALAQNIADGTACPTCGQAAPAAVAPAPAVAAVAAVAPVAAPPVWPAGANNLVAPIAPPQVRPSTRTERVLVFVLGAVLIIGSAFASWIFTSRSRDAAAPVAPPPPKVVTCVSMCTETRVATGEAAVDAQKACERICAPSPAMSTAPAAPAQASAPAAAPSSAMAPGQSPQPGAGASPVAAVSVGGAGATADCYARLRMLGFRPDDMRGCP